MLALNQKEKSKSRKDKSRKVVYKYYVAAFIRKKEKNKYNWKNKGKDYLRLKNNHVKNSLKNNNVKNSLKKY